MNNNRDDFPPHVRRSLCERVNALCSRPDCRGITRAARSDSDESFTIGRACHIHAAAPGGPRFLASQTPPERKAFANGIWLCANHGAEVDADEKTFPADLLRSWKAETEAYVRSMVGKMPSYVPEPRRSEEGLIAIGPSVLVFGRIVGHTGKAWQLSLGDFLLGDVHDLYRFADSFDSTPRDDRYLCLERAGTGGMLVRAPSIVDEAATTVTIELEPPLMPAEALAKFDVRSIGRVPAIDMARSEPCITFDTFVSGADVVPQALFMVLTATKGGWRPGDERGSRIAELNERFSGDHLESIVAVEIARLAAMPDFDDILVRTGRSEPRPPLAFVKRVRGVRMMTPTSPHYLRARLSLDIWGLPDTCDYEIPIDSSTESLGPEPPRPSASDLF